MKKKKIALIFIFVLSFSIVGALAVTQTTRVEAYSINLPTCEYEFNGVYPGASYDNSYAYKWEDIAPYGVVTKFNVSLRCTETSFALIGVTGVTIDAMSRVGKNSSDYDVDRIVTITAASNSYTCHTEESWTIFKSMGYTGHFVKAMDYDHSPSGEDYRANEWEDFDAELYDLGFKGRWIYD